MLFAKWQGTVTLPALPIRRTRIGGNLVVQHLFVRATWGRRLLTLTLSQDPIGADPGEHECVVLRMLTVFSGISA